MKTLLAIAAIAVLTPSLAAAADLTGTWKVKTKGGDGADIIVNCKIVQAGSALTGACGLDGAPDAPAPLTGSVDGGFGQRRQFVDLGFQLGDRPLEVQVMARGNGHALRLAALHEAPENRRLRPCEQARRAPAMSQRAAATRAIAWRR